MVTSRVVPERDMPQTKRSVMGAIGWSMGIAGEYITGILGVLGMSHSNEWLGWRNGAWVSAQQGL